MTSLGIFNVHIPHPNLSAASSVSDQPNPLTDTHLNTNNFSKEAPLSVCKREWGTEWGCATQVGQELPAHENVNTCAPTKQHQKKILGQNSQSQDLPLSSEIHRYK